MNLYELNKVYFRRSGFIAKIHVFVSYMIHISICLVYHIWYSPQFYRWGLILKTNVLLSFSFHKNLKKITLLNCYSFIRVFGHSRVKSTVRSRLDRNVFQKNPQSSDAERSLEMPVLKTFNFDKEGKSSSSEDMFSL